MILTEADAKTKWCPFAIASHTDPRRGFRPVDPTWATDSKTEKEFPCIGSACMAWRWAEREALETVFDQTGRPEGEGWEPYSDSPRNCAWKRPNTKPGKGYCGMAGTP